ncbi:hypothetical protein, partial [Mesorhizobium sp. P5_C1]
HVASVAISNTNCSPLRRSRRHHTADARGWDLDTSPFGSGTRMATASLTKMPKLTVSTSPD